MKKKLVLAGIIIGAMMSLTACGGETAQNIQENNEVSIGVNQEKKASELVDQASTDNNRSIYRSSAWNIQFQQDACCYAFSCRYNKIQYGCIPLDGYSCGNICGSCVIWHYLDHI